MNRKEEAWFQSPWVLGFFCGLTIVFAANMAMVWFAVSSNPGLVVEDYYERGQSFVNRTKQTFVGQSSDGPAIKLVSKIKAVASIPENIRVEIKSVDATALAPDKVMFYAYRPSDKNLDFAIELQGETSGQYLAEVLFPKYGVWDIIIEAQRGAEIFDYAESIEVAKNE